MSEPAENHTENMTEQVQHVAHNIGCVVGGVRAVIRGQPIASALVVFGLGYLFGRLGSLIPSRAH